MHKNTDKNQKRKISIDKGNMVIAVLCLILVLVVVDLFVTIGNSGKRGTFVPPEWESAAVIGTPEVPEDMGYTELYQEGMAYRICVCGIPKVEENRVEVYFTNAESNEYYLKLRILDEQDEILGESGLLKPGEYVQWLELEKELAAGTMIRLKVMSYDPETYESMGTVVMNVAVQ